MAHCGFTNREFLEGANAQAAHPWPVVDCQSAASMRRPQDQEAGPGRGQEPGPFEAGSNPLYYARPGPRNSASAVERKRTPGGGTYAARSEGNERKLLPRSIGTARVDGRARAQEPRRTAGSRLRQ